MDIAVYLFTGFLESGKTTFLNETLNDKRFCDGERTLVLICEEGETEVELNGLAEKNIFVEVIEDKEDINIPKLEALQKKHKPKKIIIEYNGMWELPDLYGSMPSDWVLYQEMTFADSRSFLTYNTNMRSLVVDKLQNCELAVFNRCSNSTDKEMIHKIVRGLNRQCNIIYESETGDIKYDDIEDPLPFDIDADFINIGLRDYAIWYRDLLEEMHKYDGKTVKFTGVIAIDNRMPDNCFIAGRPVMTCCVDDIAFKGILCLGRKPLMQNGDWISLTAELRIEKHKMYKGEGPVLHTRDYAVTSVPDEPVATFY
ncbi:MAG: GTPase [Clostridia bacterium]|nr:GTPase [Clostridia bacterium]